MTEVDNKNYGTIEEQFGRIRECIVKTETIMDFPDNYSGLAISDSLNIETDFFRIISKMPFFPMPGNMFHCSGNEKNENELINFIFGFSQNNFDTFLNNEQIDDQDKFSALAVKNIIISQLPDEFKDVRDKEMDLLYNHIEKVSKNCANYIEKNGVAKDDLSLSNFPATIIDNIFSINSKTDYDKDVKFVTDIYKNMPILTKDRIINFQGQPGFNKLVRGFLENPHKNDYMLNFFKDTIQNDPTCIYKFATTGDGRNHAYEQIEESKDFSGNFICNFPNALDENGKINCEETRCRYNVLSDILYTLNYKELPEDIIEDVKQIANLTLESLSDHIKSLGNSKNEEELKKINYLLNCPIEVSSIQDPNTKDIVTPMDLINNLRKKGVINITKEQMEQFRTEPVYLQTVEEVKNSIEFKEAVVKKQKEERDEADKKETVEGNREIKKLQDNLEAEKQRAKASRTYKFYNFFSKTFLKRETKYRTKSEILAEKKLNEKIIELSRPFFSLATKATEKQIQTLNQNISKEQTREQTKGVQVGKGY